MGFFESNIEGIVAVPTCCEFSHQHSIAKALEQSWVLPFSFVLPEHRNSAFVEAARVSILQAKLHHLDCSRASHISRAHVIRAQVFVTPASVFSTTERAENGS